MSQEVIGGKTFEARKTAAKNTHNGRVIHYIDGEAVGVETYARERSEALFASWAAPTSSSKT
jgi:hypothetical protein